ncbi:alpha-mannosidase I MNS4 [Cryptomeria japonica]|uniref:alpha-mannosidase I MNS4 n=1 Tax=Cryptomeria japonica TaxID=3369 RepID=UPI0027DA1618|nr:alpha-mannosidase I MNS4 [Cryptomeria japonica]
MKGFKEFLLLLALLVMLIRPLNGGSVTPLEAKQLRDEVKQMFYHAFDGYMEHAFPRDELRPLSCTGEDSLGGYALTLIDSLDTLALFGDKERFSEAVNWLGKNVHFNKNKTVSVFETTIRVLGGLLSAHLIASDDATGMSVASYDNELLHLSEDLARRMLPSFETPTGIPYGSVNLLYGVDENESKITSTAGGGTLTVEFGLLSRLVGDPVFEKVTKNAVRGLWAQRSEIDLVGAHINVFSGQWTQKDAGIGTSIDSFYEYLLKAYLLLGDEEYLFMFQEAYKAAMRYLYDDPWYVEVNMNSAAVVWPLFNSLQAFWPGLQVLAGDVEPAVRTHKAFFSVWKQFGFTPEGFNLATFSVQPGQRSYPLRPELIESTYWLYKATRDPMYLDVGRDIVASLQYSAWCPCGYCHIADVETHKQDDHMESFFLAETVKYLWLLFDLAVGGENMVEKGPYQYIFNTEGHLFPMSPEISLTEEHCSYVGSFCKDNHQHNSMLNNFKTDLKEAMEFHANDKAFGNDWCPATNPTHEAKDEYNAMHGLIKGICPALNHWRKYGISSLADSVATAKEPSTHTQNGPHNKQNADIRKLIAVFQKTDHESVASNADNPARNSLSDGTRLNAQDHIKVENVLTEGNEMLHVGTANHSESSVDYRSSQDVPKEG